MTAINKIESFKADCSRLLEGIYLAQANNDIQTYDLRMVRPNGGKYIQYGALHTIGHLFSSYALSSEFRDKIIYIGPMGCRTGFNLLVRDMEQEAVIKLVQEGIDFVEAFDGKIPGRSARECGNYIEHDLRRAKRYALAYKEIISDWTVDKLSY